MRLTLRNRLLRSDFKIFGSFVFLELVSCPVGPAPRAWLTPRPVPGRGRHTPPTLPLTLPQQSGLNGAA